MIEKTSATFEEHQREVLEELKAKAEENNDDGLRKVAADMEKDMQAAEA